MLTRLMGLMKKLISSEGSTNAEKNIQNSCNGTGKSVDIDML